jgi:hypothetical protein
MRADHQTLCARRLSPTFANGGSRRRPFGWAHPAAVWSSGPLRSLGECALRVGCTPRCRRSTGFAEAVWAGDAGRPLVEQRYSHFRPSAADQVSPNRPVSQIQILRTGMLRSGHWRPQPAGHEQTLRLDRIWLHERLLSLSTPDTRVSVSPHFLWRKLY